MSLSLSYKVVMVGGGSVGKTAVSIRFMQQYFVEFYDPTIEDSYRKQISMDGNVVVLEVLDTAGQDEFKSMREQWIRQGEGFFIVYSVTSKLSFSEVPKICAEIERIRQDKIQKFPVVVFGNKTDLEGLREIHTSAGEEIAATMNAPFFEGSAKANVNIEEAFFSVIRAIRKNRETDAKNDPTPNLPYGGGGKRRWCVVL